MRVWSWELRVESGRWRVERIQLRELKAERERRNKRLISLVKGRLVDYLASEPLYHQL